MNAPDRKSKCRERKDARERPPVAIDPDAPSAASQPLASRTLAAEHRAHAQYLVAVESTDYQARKYIDAHRERRLKTKDGFDEFLLRVARSGRLGLALADAYSGLFYRDALIRTKLMLSLGILECSAPSYEILDAPCGGRRSVLIRMAWRVASTALVLSIATSLLAPVHACCVLGRLRRR